jgi:Ca-activated chloride channel family protein
MKFSRAIIPFAFIGSVCVLAMSHASVASKAPQTRLPELVVLHVRVVDAADNPVADVPQTSFRVTEDGVPQTIELFINKEVPLTYGLAIDSSGSLHDQYNDVVAAATNIINSNKPDDETFVVRFISSDKIEMMQTRTSDKRLLQSAMDALYIEAGQTAVIDAIYLSADYLAKQKGDGTLRRRALILVTDGEDRNSYYKKETLFQFLASNDTQIFTIALTQELKGPRKDKTLSFLRQLATDTGGRTYYPLSRADIQNVSSQIIKDVRTQYVIGYAPAGGDPNKSFHKVQVTISDEPNQEKRVAITRVGYQTRK